VADKGKHTIVIVAGPNGAGKSTSAPHLLAGLMGVSEFVNADTIAAGLSAFKPENAAIAAGRIMLARLKTLAERKVDFAFETTLASKAFKPWLEGLIANHQYHFHLVYLWLPTPELAVARVKSRVAMGGHHVPEETIKRRYDRGLVNFFKLYRPLSKSWRFYNAAEANVRLIASKSLNSPETVHEPKLWEEIVERYGNETK